MTESELMTFEKRDEYQRKPIALNLIKLLESDCQISPVIIDGSWGTGKTEFCRKLISLLNTDNQKYKTVYIDSFRADHADEPILTILAAIINILPEKERSTLIQKALPAIRFGIKTTLKAGVSWVLKQDTTDIVEDFESDLKKAGDHVINHTVESLLQDHVSAEKNIKTLKETLAEVVKNSPIIIFIDELDRCRPDYAVSMMENIKHVFDITGVQFVLIANTDQLLASINNCYGDKIEAQRYLDKFVKFCFKLPDYYKPNGHDSVLVSMAHFKTHINNSKILKATSLNNEYIEELFETIIKQNHLSLRETETYIRYLEIYQILTDNGGFDHKTVGHVILRAFAVFIFCFKQQRGEELLRGIINVPELSLLLGKTNLLDIMKEDRPAYSDIIVAILITESESVYDNFALSDNDSKQRWNGHIVGILKGNFGAPDRGNRIKIITEAIEVLTMGIIKKK